jgi:hypothetical protein
MELPGWQKIGLLGCKLLGLSLRAVRTGVVAAVRITVIAMMDLMIAVMTSMYFTQIPGCSFQPLLHIGVMKYFK